MRGTLCFVFFQVWMRVGLLVRNTRLCIFLQYNRAVRATFTRGVNLATGGIYGGENLMEQISSINGGRSTVLAACCILCSLQLFFFGGVLVAQHHPSHKGGCPLREIIGGNPKFICFQRRKRVSFVYRLSRCVPVVAARWKLLLTTRDERLRRALSTTRVGRK